jgi:hypothetical protein
MPSLAGLHGDWATKDLSLLDIRQGGDRDRMQVTDAWAMLG